MTLIKVLNDSFVKHQGHLIPDKRPRHIEWTTDFSQQSDYTCITDYYIPQISICDQNTLGLVVESQSIFPGVYQALERMDTSRYKYLFTHSSKLLQRPNSRWIPGGGIWVGGKFGGGEIKIYPKTKMCSIVTSDKNMCALHRTRTDLAFWCNKFNHADVFGPDWNSGWVPIIASISDYRYSIIIENYIDDLYFTEKLLNCFATGTVPIYVGARNIGEKFNTDGIIQLKDYTSPLSIFDCIGEEDYNSRTYAIQDNFERCKQYEVIEDYIWENYLA